MHAAARPYVVAGAAFAAASLVVVTPVTPQPTQLPVLSIETRLVDSDSLLYVPFNLFQDIVNVPYNEVGGINELGTALLFSGTWLTASATNLWGEDPGDPSHFTALLDMAIPFPGISGQGLPEVGAPGWDQADINEAANGTLPLAQQITLFLDAEIPASASSDADWSNPLDPTPPITGDAGIDHSIETFAILSGQQQFPLINDWFQEPLSDLTNGGYNFGTVVDPSAGVGPDGSVPSDFGWAGTTPEMGNIGYGTTADGQTLDVDGYPVNLMPWSNLEFTFNPAQPFESFFNNLQDPIDPSTYLSGFEIPTFDQVGQAVETLIAGTVVAYDPFVPGSPFCSGACDVPSFLTPQGILGELNTIWPGDPSIQEWLNLFNTPTSDQFGQANPFGSANGPTQAQVDADNWLGSTEQQEYDFGNPSTADPPDTVNTPISFPEGTLIQDLTTLMQQNIIPGFDFPGTTGSSVQDYYQWQADMNGYTPIDYDTTNWLTSLPPESVTLGSFDTLLTDLGLGGLASLF
ncbi:MAG: hypothetical protein JO259_04965 [Mycobacterium sp.]|nr:hypothetical protein [Mycobacterium sp.]